jgi:hypothetical protein
MRRVSVNLNIMKSEDMSKELWKLANLMTGFSVAQSIAVAIALGKDLTDLQHQSGAFKLTITIIAIIVASGYCAAVYHCKTLATSIEKVHENIWRHTTWWRIACIYSFTTIFIFGLFAADIFREPKLTPSNVAAEQMINVP